MNAITKQHPLPLQTYQPTSAQKWMVFYAMCLAIFIVAFATTATTNAMVPIRVQMNLNPTQLQWTTNAYILAASTLMVLGGLLSDRFGRRNMNVLGGVIFVFGSIICGLASTAVMFIMGRFTQGAGVAIIMPGTLALMKVMFPESEQPTVTTGWATSLGLGMGLGPFFSGIFCKTIGWEYLYALIALVMFSAISLLVLADHKAGVTNKSVQIDFAGFVIFFLGFALFVVGFVEGDGIGWDNSIVVTCLAVGVFIMCWQPWVERHVHKTPFIDFEYFKRPRFSMGCIGMFIDGYLLISILYFGNLYIQNPLLLNYTPYEAGLALLPMCLGLTFSVLTVEKLFSRIGIAACIQLLMIISISGVIWFICLKGNMHYSMIWEPFFLIGVGCGMATKAFPAIAIEALSREEAARSSSVVSTCLYIGVIFATSIGTILSTTLGRRVFLELTSKVNAPVFDKLKVINAVIGKPGAITHILSADPASIRPALKHAAEAAALTGFQYAMISCLFFLVLAMVLTNILLKMKKYIPKDPLG